MASDLSRECASGSARPASGAHEVDPQRELPTKNRTRTIAGRGPPYFSGLQTHLSTPVNTRHRYTVRNLSSTSTFISQHSTRLYKGCFASIHLLVGGSELKDVAGY